MDVDSIKDLMISMKELGIRRIIIKEEGGFELDLQGGVDLEVMDHHHSHPASLRECPQDMVPDQMELQPSQQSEMKNGHDITSPMVGTFYHASTPEGDPFVKVGDTITEETVVCIVEAMKVMNEVKAGVKGVISEVCIENVQPVEFGTVLFRVE